MNPIIQKMNSNKVNPILRQLNSVKNPQALFANMINSNPQFRQFVEANKGKSAQQIAEEYGVDMEQLKKLINGRDV